MTTTPTDRVTEAVGAALASVGPGVYGVACSGGADSMALADTAIRVAGPQHVVVIAIDHGLRAGSADAAASVASWARGQGAAAVVRRIEVADIRHRGTEAAAREARYAALDAVADELGLAAVLIGHTARDQVETVLMRVLRGTGPAGLAGIPRRRGRFVRPLLALSRETIDAYVAARGLPVIADPMNDERAYTRVRIRGLIPELRRENPQLDAALLRLAAGAGEWLEVIDAIAAPFAKLPVDCPALARQPAAIRKRVIALVLDRADIAHDATHLGAIDRLVTGRAAGQRVIDLPDARVVRSYDHLDVVSGPNMAPDTADLVPPVGPYRLRCWQVGDRMRPARLKGRTRKLSDLYIDAKVPRALRAQARVLVRTTDDVIVWAEHLGLAHEAAESLAPTPTRTSGSF